ncbi:PREDICTED: uncharacterized protein LOC108361283 [Rhagoletis zephyria]|uniref:uncharacterized protein LOC108361283 n=1 Tax=Rhagoletis zephyria TaxID=28612 RepID=UPI0008116273|nr:PREDICTED: uncharacterized protein LOC108361283 [Rhagoletis zephyria]XP_036322147.1 uncharacterized protein LOC118736156 [Rhagoletis pomonella]
MDWDKHIPEILSVLRSDYYTSIQSSSYYAFFGPNMIQHASAYNILEKLGSLRQDEVAITSKADKLANIREHIRKNLEQAQDRAVNTYNKRTRVVNYRERQEVFRNFALSNFKQGINAKFLPKYIKCRILRNVGNALYDLENLNGKPMDRFHASDIRP